MHVRVCYAETQRAAAIQQQQQQQKGEQQTQQQPAGGGFERFTCEFHGDFQGIGMSLDVDSEGRLVVQEVRVGRPVREHPSLAATGVLLGYVVGVVTGGRAWIASCAYFTPKVLFAPRWDQSVRAGLPRMHKRFCGSTAEFSCTKYFAWSIY